MTIRAASALKEQIKPTNWFRKGKLSLMGLNWSVLTLGCLAVFTEGGKRLRETFFKNGLIDLIIFTFLFLGITLFLLVSLFKNANEQWTQKRKDDLAMIETVLGLCGIILFGVIGASPLYILIPVIASFILRGRGIIPFICVSVVGFLSWCILEFNSIENLSTLATTSIGSLALIFVVLGTVGLETIIMKSTFSMFIHYFMILLFIMLSFKLSPIMLILFPAIAFIIINFGKSLKDNILEYVKSNRILNSIYKAIFTKNLKRFFIFIVNLTKILIIVSIIGFFFLNYLAYKNTNGSGKIAESLKLTNEMAPAFSFLADKVDVIVKDYIFSGFEKVIDIIRPKTIITQFLDWIVDGDKDKYIESSVAEAKQKFIPLFGILHRIFVLIDSIIVEIGKMIGNVITELGNGVDHIIFQVLIKVKTGANNLGIFIKKILNFFGVEIEWINIYKFLGKILDLIDPTGGLSGSLTSGSIEISSSSAASGSTAESPSVAGSVIKPVTKSISASDSNSHGSFLNKIVNGLIFGDHKDPKPAFDIDPTQNQVQLSTDKSTDLVNSNLASNSLPPSIAEQEDKFNIFKLASNVLYGTALFALGGYQYALISNYGKESFSTKTYAVNMLGIKPKTKKVEDRNISTIDVHIQGETFYQRFMSTYCEHSGILSFLYKDGEYTTFSVIEKDNLNNNFGINPKYIKNNICKAENSYVEDIENKFRNIGAISPRFKKDEKDALKLFYSYFPKFLRKSIDAKIKELEATLEQAKEDVESDTRRKETLWFKILGTLFRGVKNNLGAKISMDYTEALHDLSEYYRKYYHRFMILAFYFFGNTHKIYQGAISSSIIDIYNQMVPLNPSEFSLEYIHSIIQVRTAICNRELPFINEAQSVALHYEDILFLLNNYDIYADGSEKGKVPGYFLRKISQMPLSTLSGINESDQPLKMKTPKDNEGFIVRNNIFSFKTTLKTENNLKTNREPIVITENTYSLLEIKRIEDNVVIVISLNGIPLKIVPMCINQINGCKIDIVYNMEDIEYVLAKQKKITNASKFYDQMMKQFSTPPAYAVIVSVFANHTSIAYHHIYHQVYE